MVTIGDIGKTVKRIEFEDPYAEPAPVPEPAATPEPQHEPVTIPA